MNEDIKVIFIAYNRPEYFSQTLDSIKDQIMGMDVHLMLDGPRVGTEHWFSQYTVPDDRPKILENEELFREAFKSYPDIDKRIHKLETNGCELNIIRAFKFPFEELGAKYAFFTTDDVVFSPVYMEQLKILFDFCKDDDEILLMTCFGVVTQDWPREVLDQQYCRLVTAEVILQSLWKRELYEICKPHFEVYMDLYKNSKDTHEFQAKCYKYFKGFGSYLYGFGDDAIVGATLALNNKLRISTAGEYYYHTGIHGLNSTEEDPVLLARQERFFRNNMYPKVARELYIDKQSEDLQRQKLFCRTYSEECRHFAWMT
jgi:glycosyltransferase involved in cell wall biosynthesis